MKQAGGHIAGPWIDEHVVVQVDSGGALELPAPAAIRDSCPVGAAVTVYFDEGGRVVGWIRTGSRTGVICDPAGAAHTGRIG